MKVLNERTDKIPDDAVYVGRPSKWGNPMSIAEIKRLFPNINKQEAQQKAVDWYRSYLFAMGNYELLSSIRQLKGKDLVCWCSPLPCHADILLELANAENYAKT